MCCQQEEVIFAGLYFLSILQLVAYDTMCIL
jgi:hypothetical protein